MAATWRDESTDRPFARQEGLPPLVSAAFRVAPDGERLEPDYERAYGESAGLALSPGEDVRVKRAGSLLAKGRAALGLHHDSAAAEHARGILECCAAARDEYGVSFAVYAGRQAMAGWRSSGSLDAHFPDLVAQLVSLLDQGALGHPSDAADLQAIADIGGPAGRPLSEAVRRHSTRIAAGIVQTRAIARWNAAAGRPKGAAPVISLSTAEINGRAELLGRFKAEDGQLYVTVIDQQRAASEAQTFAAATAAFDATLASAAVPSREVLTFPLSRDAPGLLLVLRPRGSDASSERRRTALFVGSLGAVLALVAALTWFALRDIGREVRTAALQSNFVTSVTHELKTPLTSIRLLAETLRMNRAPAAASHELLDGIIDETDRLARLVNNVLGAARIDRGTSVYHVADIALDASVDATIERFDQVLRHGGFTLVRDGGAPGVTVHADADGFAHALGNLLSNAIKYSRASRVLRVGVYPTDNEVEVRVTDRGIGIPSAIQRKVFDRFFRAPEAEAEAAGAGLGLSLVRHFAESHGGHVTVSSEPGAGSAFSIWLPILRSSAPHAAPQCRQGT